jgi:glyoxylase-like metal-dependent hydrolase (beta-lactamase superfamily II)
VSDGVVFDLPVLRSSRWLFNCYAITGDDGRSVLVDPGLPTTGLGALRLLEKFRHASGGLAALVATHGHSDHVAGMPAVLADRAVLNDPVVETHLPTRCAAYLAGEEPRNFGGDANVRFLPMLGQQPFSMTALRELLAGARSTGYGATRREMTLPFEPDGFLGDGQPVPCLAGWDVIGTPGHTDDSISFYHRDTATLLSGDAVLTHDGRAWFNPEWVDTDAAAATEERLRSLDVRHLLPGHGLPIEGDVWGQARSMRDCPPGKGVLTRCARRFGRWDA